MFPDAFTDFGIDTIARHAAALDHRAVPRAGAGVRRRAAEDADRPAHLRDRRQPGDGALFGRQGRPHPLHAVRRLGPRLRAWPAIVFTARLANARANNALGLELDVITVALLGGISVFGGQRQAHRRVLGAGPRRHRAQRARARAQIGGDAQGTIIGLLLIGSLLVSNHDASACSARLARSRPPSDPTGRASGDPCAPTR